MESRALTSPTDDSRNHHSPSNHSRTDGSPQPRIPRRRLATLAVGVGALLLATACSGSSVGPSTGGSTSSGSAAGCAAGATPITFWAWVPGIARAVTAFNSSHSDVCVTLDDVGAGDPEYVKLSNALKAGSGAPDVAEVEFDELPSFEVTNSLVDLSKYGADSIKSDFVPWAWQEVSQGSAVYAMPGDSGPVAFYYTSKLLAQYGITPPTTWAQFATDAATLHSHDPSASLTNFAGTDLQWILSLMAQDNAFPFQYTGGSKVTIDWTGPAQTAFANYWQALLSAHEVNATGDVDAAQFTDLDKGIDASWISSAWGPSYFAPDAKASLGDWRAAPLPQWTAGADVAANWGGSTYPVFAQSKHPAQAAEFTEWLNSSAASWAILKTAPSSLFPTYVPLLNDTSFQDITAPLSGTSKPYTVFSAAAPQIQSVQWPPFMTEALTESTTAFAGILNGTETLTAAFAGFQKSLVAYAQQQGFTVTQ
jgi:multiple sugar transport system substrate-binding protein